MKRKITVAIIATTILAFSTGTISVFATGPANDKVPTASNSNRACGYCDLACHFIDEDGDGICDYLSYCETYRDRARQRYADYGYHGENDDYGYYGGEDDGYGYYSGNDGYGYCNGNGGYGYCNGNGGYGHHRNGGHHGHH